LSRIFVSLSLLPIILIASTIGVGLWIGDYNGTFAAVKAQRAESVDNSEAAVLADLQLIEEPQRRFKYHFQLGLASALTTVLINSLSVTYLIGTSRWVKEVCEAYELPAEFINRSNQLKRQTFPWSMIGILSILTIVALGAASDPGTLRATTADWVPWHSMAAVAGACLILAAIIVQAFNLHQNAKIIDELVDEVRRERLARGLDVEPQPGSFVAS
jgi:hypothetical protein